MQIVLNLSAVFSHWAGCRTLSKMRHDVHKGRDMEKARLFLKKNGKFSLYNLSCHKYWKGAKRLAAAVSIVQHGVVPLATIV